ncbi:MAG: tryptophan--tRNA ligase, partial [Oceanospirillaceae bacterium]|nr:tryptophan--tRNA ligase [Oceanospirillaceae bacterium]
SKSYGNIIPLFAPTDELRKLIMQITTNSVQPGEAKDPATCTLFEIYSAFATAEETQAVRMEYANGIGWGEMKNKLFDYLDAYLSPARGRYNQIIADPGFVEAELQKGALKARAHSEPFMDKLRSAVGIMSLARDINIKANTGKAKKELSTEAQAKADAGKAKGLAIAKQRAEQEAQQLAQDVDQLMAKVNANENAQAAGEEAVEDLNLQIQIATKKTRKGLQKTLQLLQQRLSLS